MGQILAATIIFGSIGLIFSLLLAFLNQKLKVTEDPQAKKILDKLPGLNCGACGFSSCRAYAQAAVKKPEIFRGCRPAGDDTNEKIAKLLGLQKSLKKEKKSILICNCQAEEDEKKITSLYLGIKTCQAAHSTGGALDCLYGCLGFGDCKEACPANAITIKRKKVYINQKKCILCGKCIRACPRRLFQVIPRQKDKRNYFIACQNKDKLKEVKDVCSRGCITCGLCARIENSPYRIEENLARIDYKRAGQIKLLEAGKNKCPTKCIDAIGC